MASHAHLKAGWTYSPLSGEAGGWELPLGTDGLVRIACTISPAMAKEMSARKGHPPVKAGWHAFVVRHRDGATLFSQRCGTRAEAMEAAATWAPVVLEAAA